MPADVCAWVAAKIRAWTFPLLPGCTSAKCHRSPGPLLWFLYMESATRTGSKSETEPFDRTGARCLLKANMPVSSQECSCWVHVWAVKRPSWFVFHSLECKLYHWIAFTACSLLAWGYPLMHFFTVGKLHWHFSGWISPCWTRNFWGGKLLFCVEQHLHPLSNAHIQRNACKVSPGSYFIAIPHPLDAQTIHMWVTGVTSLPAAAAHHLCLLRKGSCEYLYMQFWALCMFCPVPEEKWVLLAVFHHKCLKAKDQCSEGCKIKHPNQLLLVHQGK